MNVDISAPLLVAFLLVVVRTSAWLALAPPFGTKAVPSVVKVALSVALALPMAPRMVRQAPSPQIPSLVTAILIQVAVGLVLGFLTMLLFAAVQAAGEFLDLFSGLSLAQVYDPTSGSGSSPFGRFYQLVAITLLFAADGHLLLVRGFLSSFDVLPLRPDPTRLTQIGIDSVGRFFVSALEIAAPIVAVLFVAEIALGLVAKAAPSLNVFNTSFPLKILLTLSLVGFAIALLPGAVERIVEHVLHVTALTTRLLPR